MMRQRAQHRRQLVDIGAAAAQLARHAGLDQAGRLEQLEVLGDEAVLVGRSSARWAKMVPSSRAMSTAFALDTGFNSATAIRYAPSRWRPKAPLMPHGRIIAPTVKPIQFRICIGPRSAVALFLASH